MYIPGHFLTKGQLNSEWIYEVIVSPKMPTKNWKDFCPESLLEGRTKIFPTFGLRRLIQWCLYQSMHYTVLSKIVLGI